MCLIIDRPEGVEIDEALLENGIDDNGDGWGIMRADNGRLKIVRGLKRSSFFRAWKKLGDAACTIHFRLATHGETNVHNCHPFDILGKQYAVMHNGVMNDAPVVDKARSDTWHFANLELAPLLAEKPSRFESPAFADWLGEQIGYGNKLVVTRNDGVQMFVNRELGVEHKSLWLSNDNSTPGSKYREFIKAYKTRGVPGAWSAHECCDYQYDRSGRTTGTSRHCDDIFWSLSDFYGSSWQEIYDAVRADPSGIATMIADYLDEAYGVQR